MKEWYSARELAGLPGLPTSEWRVVTRAAREGWLSRPREGRGGGQDYHRCNLPIPTRLHLARGSNQNPSQHANDATEIADAPVVVPLPPLPQRAECEPRRDSASAAASDGASHHYKRGEAPSSYLALPDWARSRADARADLVRMFRAFHALAGCSLRVAEIEFAARYNGRTIEVADDVRRAIPEVGAATISRWRRRLEKRGLAALADRHGRRRGSGAIERAAELRDFIVAMIADKPHMSARQVYAASKARGGKAAIRLAHTQETAGATPAPATKFPSLRTVTRFIARWRREHASELLALTNPDAWNNRYRLALADAASEIERLNQRWEIDASPLDAMCKDGRHCVIALIDIYGRRVMFRVTKTVSAHAATLLLGRAIREWGVPEEVHGDNGKEFVSRHFQRALDHLGIAWVASTPFSGWEKPFVERVIGTVMHELMPMLPGYIGANVAARQAIRSRQSFSRRFGKKDAEIFQVELTSEQLQSRLDLWARNVYANRAHSGLDGRTPNEAAAQWAGEVRWIGDERALDVLLAQAPGAGGLRMVGKEGIRVDNAWFFALDLVPFIGSRVRVLYDEDDLGRIVVYAESGEFICIAENLERAGVSRRDMAILGHQAQERKRTEQRAEMRRLKNFAKPHWMHEAWLEAHAQNANDLPSAAIDVIHETAALAAAGEAAEARAAIALAVPRPSISPYSEIDNAEMLARGDQAIAAMDAAAQNREQYEQEADALWERYLALANQSEIGDQDRAWVRSYEVTPACRSRKFLAEAKEQDDADAPMRAAG